MNSSIDIQLFGDFALTQDEQIIGELDSPRLQGLLAYLLLNKDSPQPRQRLAFLFWPDASETQARTNLRNLLHRLKQAWPQAHNFLEIDSKNIAWRSQAKIHVDVFKFEQHLHQAQAVNEPQEALAHLQEAIRLQRRELLPNCYDDWIIPERQRLQQALRQAIEKCAGLYEKLGDLKNAIQMFQQLIQADTLQEPYYRDLMRLHVLNGDRAAALRVYYQCVDTLRQELKVAPDDATQQSYKRLLALDAPVETLLSTATPADASLVGRSLEWEQLAQTWRQVSVGKRPPVVALISGEAGVGKTTLASEIVRWIKHQGTTIASATCYAPEADLSLAPAASWLRALSLKNLAPVWKTELARLLPELADSISAQQESWLPQQGLHDSVAEPWQKGRFYEAMARAVLSQKQPLCLQLEDVQWSDDETLAWLHYLLRLDASARLMVIATLRLEELSPEHPLQAILSTWRQQGRIVEIYLAPFDATESAALAANLAGRELPPDISAALYRHTEGNPLFIVETIRSLLEPGENTRPQQGTLTDSHLSPFDQLLTFDSSSPPAMTPKIQAVLRRRLDQLSPAARNLAGAAAVIGRSFSGYLLLQAGDADEDEMVRALDELWRKRIIHDRLEDTYDFSHDKIRQAAYDTLSPARRRWLHGRVAQTLEKSAHATTENLAGRLAFHFEAAGEVHKALHYHTQAAALAQQVYAYQEALFHLRAAIDLLERTPPQPGQAAELYEQLGDIHSAIGQHQPARQAYLAAQAEAGAQKSPPKARLMLKAAQTWLSEYELQAAWKLLEEAQTLLGPTADFEAYAWRVWLDISLSQLDVLYFQADLEKMTELASQIQPTLERHGSLQQNSVFYHILVQIESRRTRFRHTQQAVKNSCYALSLAEQSNNETLIHRSRFGLGFTLLWAGQIQDAIQELTEAVELSQAAGNIPLLDRCLAYLSIAHRMSGQIEFVESILPRCLAVAESEKNALYIGVANANQAWLDYHNSNLAQAANQARRALWHWNKLIFPFHWLACWPVMAASLTYGDLATTIAQAKIMLAPEQQKQPAEIESILMAALEGEPDDSAQARSLLEQALSLAKGNQQL